jgi:hypothetical protein
MRSISQIINLVVDGVIVTKEQAAALVKQETQEAAEFYRITEEEARTALLTNIGHVTGYLPDEQADNVMDLFETEHPVYGRQHPAAEEAYRMGQEYANRKRRTIDDQGRTYGMVQETRTRIS